MPVYAYGSRTEIYPFIIACPLTMPFTLPLIPSAAYPFTITEMDFNTDQGSAIISLQVSGGLVSGFFNLAAGTSVNTVVGSFTVAAGQPVSVSAMNPGSPYPNTLSLNLTLSRLLGSTPANYGSEQPISGM